MRLAQLLVAESAVHNLGSQNLVAIGMLSIGTINWFKISTSNLHSASSPILIDLGPNEQDHFAAIFALNMISSSKYTGEDIDLIAGFELPFWYDFHNGTSQIEITIRMI